MERRKNKWGGGIEKLTEGIESKEECENERLYRKN